MKPRVLAALALLVASAALGAVPSSPQAPENAGRIVAVGDVHGAFDAFTGLLQQTGLVDAQLKWTGQNATLVQLGDMIDRGPKSRAVMDLLMSLQRDAPRSGGRVIVLLGNHEAMDMFGDVRYVSAEDYASFADGESEHRRTTAFGAARAVHPGATADQAHWMAGHPLGFVERANALGRDGNYGKWLRSLPAVALVNETLFVHGGISPEFASWNIGHLNDAIRAEIRTFDAAKRSLVAERLALPFDTLDELAAAARAPAARASADLSSLLDFDHWLSVRDEGPLWFRGYAEWSDDTGAPLVDHLLDALKVKRLVVGHSVQTGAIARRFSDRVFLIDTGMLAGYFPGGRASALVIEHNNVTTVYAGAAK